MPRVVALLLPLLAALALAATAAADGPGVFVITPGWFVESAYGGASWKVQATGSIPPVDGSEYGADPDVSLSGTWNFSDPGDGHTVIPGISYWPRAFSTVENGSRALVNQQDAELLAIQHRSVTDTTGDFVVFALNTHGNQGLEGEYYTCGPAAFQPNPSGLGNNGAPGYYDGPFYAEGSLALSRSGSPPAAPSAPLELYGFYGAIGGESPFCQQARDTPSLWTTVPPPPAANDDRRATETDVVCDRGPNPGDPYTCNAMVIDKDQRFGAFSPTGVAAIAATAGSLSTSSCTLTASASSPTTSFCTFTYLNPELGLGNQIPITVSYGGSGEHKPSSGTPQYKGEKPGPQPADGIVCGAPPLTACEGQVPQSTPVQTCVGNVGGSCVNLSNQPAPIKVCIGNVIGACAGFTGGAQFAGELEEQAAAVEATIACPQDSEDAAKKGDDDKATRATTRQAPGTFEASDCRGFFALTSEERALVRQYDALFAEEVRIRYAVFQAIGLLPARTLANGGSLTVYDTLRPSVLRSMLDHNHRVEKLNPVLAALESIKRIRLDVGPLAYFRSDTTISDFSPYAKGADGSLYVDPRLKSASARATTAAAKKKGKVVKGYGPSRKGQKTGTVTVAQSATVTVKAGATKKVKVPLTKFGKALLAYVRAQGGKSLAVGATVSMTSPQGRFAPTTVTKAVTLKIKKKAVKKKKPAAKGKKKKH